MQTQTPSKLHTMSWAYPIYSSTSYSLHYQHFNSWKPPLLLSSMRGWYPLRYQIQLAWRFVAKLGWGGGSIRLLGRLYRDTKGHAWPDRRTVYPEKPFMAHPLSRMTFRTFQRTQSLHVRPTAQTLAFVGDGLQRYGARRVRRHAWSCQSIVNSPNCFQILDPWRQWLWVSFCTITQNRPWKQDPTFN